MRLDTVATPELALVPPAPAPARRREAVARSGVEIETTLIGRILWRRRRWIAATAAAAFLGALGYCLVATPQYTATAQILVDPRDKQVVSNDVNPSSIAADGGVTQVESQGSVLQSNGVLLRAIAATHLENDSEFNGSGLLSGVGRLFSVLWKAPDADDMAERLKAETLLALRKHMVVKRADKVLVLDLAVRARTAGRAAELANAIADAYLADQADARASAGRDASKALASRLGELHGDVKTAEDAVADYRARHNFVVSSGQLVTDQAINQTSAQLSAAENRVASLKAQLDQLHSDPGAQGTPEAMASGVMVRLRDRESAIVERLASARKQLGPLHPEIGSMEQSLQDVRGLIAKETQRLRQAAEADYARAAQDESTLAKKLDAMKSQSLDDDKADVRLRDLERQADAARTIYQTFLVRAKETLEASNVDTTNARIITHALPPLQKSWPPSLLLLLGAAFLGLSLGASGSLAHEYVHPALYTPDQARDLVDAPSLGLIAARDLNPALGVKSPRKSADAAARAVLRALGETEADGETQVGPCVFVAGPASAALWRARFAERIAALSAAGGRNTLLIDGDFVAGESERPGLLDLFRGEHSVADLAYRESGERFQRLSRGVGDPFAATPRGVDAFRLRRARRCYDLIVIDGGALADNLRLSPLAGPCDFVALVVELGGLQAAVRQEADSAESAGARIHGVALVDPREI